MKSNYTKESKNYISKVLYMLEQFTNSDKTYVTERRIPIKINKKKNLNDIYI